MHVCNKEWKDVGVKWLDYIHGNKVDWTSFWLNIWIREVNIFLTNTQIHNGITSALFNFLMWSTAIEEAASICSICNNYKKKESAHFQTLYQSNTTYTEQCDKVQRDPSDYCEKILHIYTYKIHFSTRSQILPSNSMKTIQIKNTNTLTPGR